MLVQKLCGEEEIGFVDVWGGFFGRAEMYTMDGLHLNVHDGWASPKWKGAVIFVHDGWASPKWKGAVIFADELSGAVNSVMCTIINIWW